MTAPAPTAGPSEATGTAPAGAPDATPASPAPSTGQAPAAPPVASTVDDLPDWAQKALKDARAEAAKTRVESKAEADARVKALLQAAGIETDETDPAKAADQIARERDEARSEVRSIKVERAIELAGRTAGADADLLVAVLSHKGELSKLDPAADDFAAAVKAAIDKAIADNPKLKTGQAPGASGVDHSGGSGEGAHTLDAQIAEATKAGNHGLAIALKRQAAATT